MASGRAMNRLVQGDVGSGKTLVAAALVWYAARNGLQSAFMAPTELLCEQHYATLSGFLAPFGIKTVKLTAPWAQGQARGLRRARLGRGAAGRRHPRADQRERGL